jgi:hypothetical protein
MQTARGHRLAVLVCKWLSQSRNPSPTKRRRLQALEEDDGVIIAVELGRGGEAGDEAGNDL